MANSIRSITVYHSKHKAALSFSIQYMSGCWRYNVPAEKLSKAAINFMMFRTPQKTANEDVEIFR